MTTTYEGPEITLSPSEVNLARTMYSESFLVNGRIRLPYPQEIVASAAGQLQFREGTAEFQAAMHKLRCLGLVV